MTKKAPSDKVFLNKYPEEDNMSRIIVLLVVSFIIFGCSTGIESSRSDIEVVEAESSRSDLQVNYVELNEFDGGIKLVDVGNNVFTIKVVDCSNNVFLFVPDYTSGNIRLSTHLALGFFIKNHPELEIKSHTIIPTDYHLIGAGGKINNGEVISAIFEPKTWKM